MKIYAKPDGELLIVSENMEIEPEQDHLLLQPSTTVQELVDHFEPEVISDVLEMYFQVLSGSEIPVLH